jgi:hypothetical protein
MDTKMINSAKKAFLMLMVALLAVTFTDCKKETIDTEMQTAVIKGKARDINGSPLAGVLVSSGTQSATTASDGSFTFNKVKVLNSRAVVKFEKNGYFAITRSLIKESDMYIEVALVQKGNSSFTASASFDAKTAKTLMVSGMKVNIPASSVVRADGSAYRGSVKADMLYLDPNNEKLAEIMPGGDLSAVQGNKQVQLITYGMAEVSLTDNEGNALQLKSGEQSQLTFPIPEGMEDNPPTTIPLWSFDEERGIWAEEGEATLQGNVYVGNVEHFSWHNLDQFVDGSVTIRGKLTDCENNKVSYIKVSVKEDGTVYSTGVVSNGNGEYSVKVLPNVPVTISIKSRDFYDYMPEISYTIPGQPAGTEITRNFSLPCKSSGTGEPQVGFCLSEASVIYLMSGEEMILTYDNYGRRSRMDNDYDEDPTNPDHFVVISDSTTMMNYIYTGSDEWETLPFSEYGALSMPFFTLFNFPTGIPDWQTSTEVIAGKSCTIYQMDFPGGYYKIGIWNCLLMLMETQEDGVMIIAKSVVTDVPDAAFTQTVPVTWIQ